LLFSQNKFILEKIADFQKCTLHISIYQIGFKIVPALSGPDFLTIQYDCRKAEGKIKFLRLFYL